MACRITTSLPGEMTDLTDTPCERSPAALTAPPIVTSSSVTIDIRAAVSMSPSMFASCSCIWPIDRGAAAWASPLPATVVSGPLPKAWDTRRAFRVTSLTVTPASCITLWPLPTCQPRAACAVSPSSLSIWAVSSASAAASLLLRTAYPSTSPPRTLSTTQGVITVGLALGLLAANAVETTPMVAVGPSSPSSIDSGDGGVWTE